MIHKMGLKAQPFNEIKTHKKIVEVRLYDIKRKAIKLGDIIEFGKEPDRKEKIKVQVVDLLKYKTFTELIENCLPENIGVKNKKEFLNNIYKYYSKQDEQKYGVLGIKIKLI